MTLNNKVALCVNQLWGDSNNMIAVVHKDELYVSAKWTNAILHCAMKPICVSISNSTLLKMIKTSIEFLCLRYQLTAPTLNRFY